MFGEYSQGKTKEGWKDGRKEGRKKTKNYMLKCGKQLFEKVPPSKEMLSSILKHVNGLN
jgi:hypothetical protein